MWTGTTQTQEGGKRSFFLRLVYTYDTSISIRMFTHAISISTRQHTQAQCIHILINIAWWDSNMADAAVRAGLETVFGIFPLTTNTFIFLTLLLLLMSPGSHLQHNDISINIKKRNEFLFLMLMLMLVTPVQTYFVLCLCLRLCLCRTRKAAFSKRVLVRSLSYGN